MYLHPWGSPKDITMTHSIDWRFWTVVTLISAAFLLAFLSVGDGPTVSALEAGTDDVADTQDGQATSSSGAPGAL